MLRQPPSYAEVSRLLPGFAESGRDGTLGIGICLASATSLMNETSPAIANLSQMKVRLVRHHLSSPLTIFKTNSSTWISPNEAEIIIARGHAFGLSRVICNVHWYSDALAGRTIGAAIVARLHGNPAFRSELLAAEDELNQVKKRGVKPTRDCQWEQRAIALQQKLFLP